MKENELIVELRKEIALRDERIAQLEAELSMGRPFEMKANPSVQFTQETDQYRRLWRLKERIKKEYIQMIRQIAKEIQLKFNIVISLNSDDPIGDYVIGSDPTFLKIGKIRDDAN